MSQPLQLIVALVFDLAILLFLLRFLLQACNADFYNQLEIEAPMAKGYNAREKAIWQFCERYKS